MWTLPLVLFATFAALVSGKVRIEIVALALVATLGLTGLVEPGEALSGFSSEATIAVASMLVISAALERTGVVGWLARVVGRGAGKSRTGLLVALAIPGVLLSAFMNNTAIVALMIPVALELGRRRDVRPSKLLIPVSYFSILGGTCTLVGTSTNLLVDSLARNSGHAGFGMFEFTGLGLCYVAIGTVYILFIGARTLPDRTGFTDLLAVQSPGRFITEIVLRSGSRHAGKRIGDVFGGRDLRVIEIVRDETPLLAPKGDTQLEVGDVLYVESSAQNLTNLLADPDVERGTAVADDERVPLNELLAGEMFEGANALFMQAAEAAEQGVKAQRVDLRLAEAVITPNSRFLGRALRDLGLSRRHGIQVLAIRRFGKEHHKNLRTLALQAGDVLLVQGEPQALRTVDEDGDFLLIEGVEKTLTIPKKAPLAIAILVGVITLGALGIASFALLAVAGAALMLLTRCLTTRNAMRALDPAVLLLIAAMIPLGIAMERTGLASQIAQGVFGVVGESSPQLLLAVVYLLTFVLTEFVSNNATAVLMTPICIGMATHLGMDPKPFLVAVTFGASASFSTPIGYQTNTMVMGPGGYTFRDFLRIGLPLNLVLWVAASLLIPLFWEM